MLRGPETEVYLAEVEGNFGKGPCVVLSSGDGLSLTVSE